MKRVGFTGGGQVGYNLQSGVAVWGVEADVGWLGLKGNASYPLLPSTFANTDGGIFTTVRGRLGFSLLPSNIFMVYVTGGYFGADFDSTVGTNGAAPVKLFNVNNTGFQSGWTIGAGGEMAWTDHWSVKVEWLNYQVGNKAIGGNFAGGGSTVQFFKVENFGNLVRAGLNYHF
jgi:outer membrane immunogenic protein